MNKIGSVENAGDRKEVSRMADFASAAFPWVAMGLAVAVVLTYRNSKEKMQEKKKQ